ncbi:MAG TPA: enediyne biosynthesis protein UnbU [Thermoanaerobaculia bacterium]|nr:enediyne biosynthesis protein UnbU [Thermoanaerobaculia bacterium]
MTDAKDLRLPALRRFAFAITALNLLGHTVLGFEQSWAAPLAALAAAYAAEVALEVVAAWQQGRRPRFLAGGFTVGGMVDFLLSAHISGLAVSMLLYSGERLAPIVFAAVVAIGSKHVFRAPAPGAPPGAGSRHFLNPSNFGITVTLLAFSYVGIAQPYMFTEKLNATGAWVLPAVLVCAGTFFNGRFTRKLPLIAGWVGGFVLQAMVRWWAFGNLPRASLMPLTGVALLLFTFYMVTDPATTPVAARHQVAFGAAVATVYGALLASHVVFTPFFALTLVAMGRGALLWLTAWRLRAATAAAAAPGPARPAPVAALAPAARRALWLVEGKGRPQAGEAPRAPRAAGRPGR